MQTTLAFGFAAARAENARGNEGDIERFFRLALDQGGEWLGFHGPQGNDHFGRYHVTGFLADVGDDLDGADLPNGKWTIAWGPAMYRDGLKQTLANGMFVVHSAARDMYVVAVSPTNFASDYAVLLEDFDNEPTHMVDFPVDPNRPIDGQHRNIDRGRPQLTGGTARGVHVLCNLRGPESKLTLPEFLARAVKSSATRLVFAGHSLGGALSPALAQQLDGGLIASGWGRDRIPTLPTAGATPGNLKFFDGWNARFGVREPGTPLHAGNEIRLFNKLYRNKYDFVPHAFTHINGSPPEYWNQYDSSRPKRMDTLCGICVDDACEPMNKLYAQHQLWAILEQLNPLPNVQFVGKFPVRYWGSDGTAQSYARFPAGEMTKDQLDVAMQMAHMGQYYEAAAIDPHDIQPVVRRLS
jgi:hypothetical protein